MVSYATVNTPSELDPMFFALNAEYEYNVGARDFITHCVEDGTCCDYEHETCTVTKKCLCDGSFQEWHNTVDFDNNNPLMCELCDFDASYGACCTDGDCEMSYQSECDGDFQGSGSLCSPNPCSGNTTSGSCCYIDGGLTRCANVANETECDSYNNSTFYPGVPCNLNSACEVGFGEGNLNCCDDNDDDINDYFCLDCKSYNLEECPPGDDDCFHDPYNEDIKISQRAPGCGCDSATREYDSDATDIKVSSCAQGEPFNAGYGAAFVNNKDILLTLTHGLVTNQPNSSTPAKQPELFDWGNDNLGCPCEHGSFFDCASDTIDCSPECCEWGGSAAFDGGDLGIQYLKYDDTQVINYKPGQAPILYPTSNLIPINPISGRPYFSIASSPNNYFDTSQNNDFTTTPLGMWNVSDPNMQDDDVGLDGRAYNNNWSPGFYWQATDYVTGGWIPKSAFENEQNNLKQTDLSYINATSSNMFSYRCTPYNGLLNGDWWKEEDGIRYWEMDPELNEGQYLEDSVAMNPSYARRFKVSYQTYVIRDHFHVVQFPWPKGARDEVEAYNRINEYLTLLFKILCINPQFGKVSYGSDIVRRPYYGWASGGSANSGPGTPSNQLLMWGPKNHPLADHPDTQTEISDLDLDTHWPPSPMSDTSVWNHDANIYDYSMQEEDCELQGHVGTAFHLWGDMDEGVPNWHYLDGIVVSNGSLVLDDGVYAHGTHMRDQICCETQIPPCEYGFHEFSSCGLPGNNVSYTISPRLLSANFAERFLGYKAEPHWVIFDSHCVGTKAAEYPGESDMGVYFGDGLEPYTDRPPDGSAGHGEGAFQKCVAYNYPACPLRLDEKQVALHNNPASIRGNISRERELRLLEGYGPDGQGPLPPIVIGWGDCSSDLGGGSAWWAITSECGGKACAWSSDTNSSVLGSMAVPIQGCGNQIQAPISNVQQGYLTGGAGSDHNTNVPCEIEMGCGKRTFGPGSGNEGVQGWCAMVEDNIDPSSPSPEIVRMDITSCQTRLNELHNEDNNIVGARWELLSSTMLDMDERHWEADCNQCLYPHYKFDDDELNVPGEEIDTQTTDGTSKLGSCCIRLGDRGWPGNPDEPLERIWTSPWGDGSTLKTKTDTLVIEDSGAEDSNRTDREWHAPWFRSDRNSEFDEGFPSGWSYAPNFRWELAGDVAWGPQLVGWVCGFNSPAYQTAKAIYDTATQSWKKTINYCFDSFTCPALWKEPTEENLTEAGLWGHEECVEPTLWGYGGLATGTFAQVGDQPWNIPDEDSPLGRVCYGVFVNAKNIWDISSSAIEQVPVPGLQAPIDCEQCSLGYINAPDDGSQQYIGLGHKDDVAPNVWTPGAAMTARNLRGAPHINSTCMAPEIEIKNHNTLWTDWDGNISLSQDSVFGICNNPDGGSYEDGNYVDGGGVHPDALIRYGESDKDQGYFPCRCTARNLTHYTDTSYKDHIDPNSEGWMGYPTPALSDLHHAHHVESLFSWQLQYHIHQNPFSWQEGDYISDPRLPGVCALKHNFVPSLVVELSPQEGTEIDLDEESLDWKQRFDWKRRTVNQAHGDHHHTTSYLRNYASDDEFTNLNNPIESSNMIGSCCYYDGENKKYTAVDGISQTDCENNKLGIWDRDKTSDYRVKHKEPLCCKTCSKYARTDYEKQQINRSQRVTFRSMVHNNSVIAVSPTKKDIEENYSLLQELISICENCDHSNEYNLNACSRVAQIIKIYEDEKDISCFNSRKEGLEDTLKEYYRCKCTLLDEIVSNLLQVYKLNVCVKDINPSSVEETTLMSSINELLSNYKILEDNCYEIIKDHDDIISTKEKQKGCCCQYIKPGSVEFINISSGTKIYNGGDLRKCGNMTKFECSKLQAYDTVWNRCVDDCSDNCRDNDNPDNCQLCNSKINNTNIPYSKEILTAIQEELNEEEGTPIRSCCFGRTPTREEVPRGTDPERYTIYDCAYGFTKNECHNSKWLDDDKIKSTRWREDDCGKCTCCKDGERYCLQSGGCNPTNRSSSPDSYIPESSGVSSVSPTQTGGASTQRSSSQSPAPQTGTSSGGYGY